MQHLCSLNSGLCRKNTKFILLIFQILLGFWIFGLLLNTLTKEKNVTIKTKREKKIFDYEKRRFHEMNKFEADFVPFTEDDLANMAEHRKNRIQTNDLQSFYFEPTPYQLPADCEGIINGDAQAITDAALMRLELKSQKNTELRQKMEKLDDSVVNGTNNCTHFRLKRKYLSFSLTPEERNYPIAYIITIHNNFNMFERLLRAVYHPHNIYCVHVDKKAPAEFLEDVRKLVRCFNNIFVASKLVEVRYTHWSRVQADINCLNDLVEKTDVIPWKYVINLCGQDFPLKTNLEIVRSLKSLQGYNNMETITVPEHKKKRYEFRYELPNSSKNNYALMERTEKKKSPSPLNNAMFSGSAYFIWKRQAVEYFLGEPTIQKFFQWNEDSYSPDEHMWASLQRWYPYVPGSSPPHMKYDLNELQSITRLVKWGGLDSVVYPKCAGQFRRGVCVYGVGDLFWLLNQHHLFANKFDPSVDRYAIECLDRHIRNRAINQTSMYLAKGYV